MTELDLHRSIVTGCYRIGLGVGDWRSYSEVVAVAGGATVNANGQRRPVSTATGPRARPGRRPPGPDRLVRDQRPRPHHNPLHPGTGRAGNGAGAVAPRRAGQHSWSRPVPQRPSLLLCMRSPHPGGPLGARAGPDPVRRLRPTIRARGRRGPLTRTSLFHKAVPDASVLCWSWDALMEGRSHSDTWVGWIVRSTTASSSPVSVSRSTCWRSRAPNAVIVLAAS